MRKHSLEESENILTKLDKNTFKSRVKRHNELGIITTSIEEKSPSVRGDQFLQEASTAYINGCFRSCIFCCANIIEQTLKHGIIGVSEDPEEMQWTMEIKRFTFGIIVEEAKKIKRLKPYTVDADWLCKVRNTIAVHPLYVDLPRSDDTKESIIRKNKTIIRDIKKILPYLNKKTRSMIDSMFIYESKSGETIEINIEKIKKEGVFLRDILNDPLNQYSRILWQDFQRVILQSLALDAYERMKRILRGLYPVKK